MPRIRLDALTPHPRNPNRGDVAAVARSLERFGQRKPIVVQHRETGTTIIAGHTTAEAARTLGWTEIDAITADDLTEPEADGYLLADNSTGQRSTWDPSDLFAAMLALRETPDLLEATGLHPFLMARAVESVQTAATAADIATSGAFTLADPLPAPPDTTQPIETLRFEYPVGEYQRVAAQWTAFAATHTSTVEALDALLR